MPDTRSGRTSSMSHDSDEFDTPINSPESSPNRGRGNQANASPPHQVVIDQPSVTYLTDIDKKVEEAIVRALNGQLAAIREEVMSTVDTRLEAMKKEICDDYTTKLENLSGKVNRLQAQNDMLRHELELRGENIDDNIDNIERMEQYGRRYSVRIANVPFDGEQEEDDDLLVTVKEKLAAVDPNLKLAEHDVVRLHRIGDEKTDRDGIKCKNIIIKLSNWSARQRVLKDFNKKAAAKKLPTRIFHDLTTQRFRLLNHAKTEVTKRLESAGLSKDAIKKLPDQDKMFAFVSPNCELRLRRNGRVYKFDSKTCVDTLIDGYVPPRK